VASWRIRSPALSGDLRPIGKIPQDTHQEASL
jgi:hypothetical protein